MITIPAINTQLGASLMLIFLVSLLIASLYFLIRGVFEYRRYSKTSLPGMKKDDAEIDEDAKYKDIESTFDLSGSNNDEFFSRGSGDDGKESREITRQIEERLASSDAPRTEEFEPREIPQQVISAEESSFDLDDSAGNANPPHRVTIPPAPGAENTPAEPQNPATDGLEAPEGGTYTGKRRKV